MGNKTVKKKQYESFNLYYLNLSKVYEISMMINNIIVSSYERETGNSTTKRKYKKSSLDGQIDSKYLASVKSILETGSSKEKVTSSKVTEKLDVKTTKSILSRSEILCLNPFSVTETSLLSASSSL